MHRELQAATGDLAHYLRERLPALSAQWWKEHVHSRLSFQQQRYVDKNGITELEDLDMAALLRILDQNWYELSRDGKLSRNQRSLIKELQSVRGKWMHTNPEDIPPTEVYRDADTLNRVLEMIDAKRDTLSAIESFKNNAFEKMAKKKDIKPFKKIEAQEEKTKLEYSGSSVLFKIGEIVALRSNPDIKFPILEIDVNGPEPRYKVFQDGAVATYYQSQIQSPPGQSIEKTSISVEEFKGRLTALHLLSPSTENLFSLRSGRINFVPYQYRPVLKMIRSDQHRILVADEVGVGKTIEAGLILKELRARTDLSSVLIICPKPLVNARKWQEEMKRFDEEFVHIDGPLLRHCIRETHIDGKWPSQYERAILPFSLFSSDMVFGPEEDQASQDKGLIDLDPPPQFDLVIVDEAHHIRNPDTILNKGVEHICNHANAVVLLSATPVQLGSNDLFTLLNVLRSDLIFDRASFDLMAEPNKYMNQAIKLCRQNDAGWSNEAARQLSRAAQTEWGRMFLREGEAFQSAFDICRGGDVSDEERVTLIRELEELYTFSSLINRTRRRDIGEFTVRRPETVTVNFTTEQQSLHDDLLDVIARILEKCHGHHNVKFMMSVIRRQAASCLYGLAPLISDILDRKLERLDMVEIDEDFDLKFVDEIGDEISDIVNRAQCLDPVDPKIEAFIQAIVKKSKHDKNKSLVFSTFRHTISYISNHIDKTDLRYGIIHGDVRDNDRTDIRHRFSLPKDDPNALDVLLSSEVGCEGLDFQFCDFLVNYDLPWNPMKVEQRIGRIDRYGQTSEAIGIVNFVTPGTVDADIYTRCLERIGVFNNAVGGSEEILGEITKEIQYIASDYTLTPSERAKQLQQLSDNAIRLVKEEQDLEKKEFELFGLDIPRATWREDIRNAESEWLSPDAIRQCIETYLKLKIDPKLDYLSGDRPLKTLRLKMEERNVLLDDFMKIPPRSDRSWAVWKAWLSGRTPTIQVTLDQETAADNRSAIHLTALHPLAKQAAQYFDTRDVLYCDLRLTSGEMYNIQKGEYKFALYRWKMLGIRDDEKLITVCDDAEVESVLLSHLGRVTDPKRRGVIRLQDFEELEERHHSKWLSARASHIEKNQEIAEYKIQSLTASHRERIRILEKQVNSAVDNRIRRMRLSQLEHAEALFARQIAKITEDGNGGDIIATPVLLGTLIIDNEEISQ